mgnify:CR=1 FL=1
MSRVQLALNVTDVDAAGQGAAERFYEWEEKHQVEVSVARLPEGRDPGDLARSDPAVLTAAVDDPDLIRTCATRFGSQCVVLSVDTRSSKGARVYAFDRDPAVAVVMVQ